MKEQDKRIFKINVKVSEAEKKALVEIMAREEKSLSDIIRMAIRNTFEVSGFEPSYNNCYVYGIPKRKSIFD